MSRFDLIAYTGVLREYKPYKPPRRPLVEHIGISSFDLTIIICFILSVSLFGIMFVRWWLV